MTYEWCVSCCSKLFGLIWTENHVSSPHYIKISMFRHIWGNLMSKRSERSGFMWLSYIRKLWHHNCWWSLQKNLWHGRATENRCAVTLGRGWIWNPSVWRSRRQSTAAKRTDRRKRGSNRNVNPPQWESLKKVSNRENLSCSVCESAKLNLCFCFQ